MRLPGFGEIIKVNRPREFFSSNPDVVDQVAEVVRRAFGRNLEYDDIYQHITSPENVYLLKNGEINAMASYNRRVLSGIPALVAEGIAVAPEIQGKGLFRMITDVARERESVICLRTQSPRMYRALEKYCSAIYPGPNSMPRAIGEIRGDLAEHLGCAIDEKGVVKGYYGGLFYAQEPAHKSVSPFFKEVGVDVNKGDALLVVGVR